MKKRAIVFTILFMGFVWALAPIAAQCADPQPVDIGDLQVNGIDVVGSKAYVANDTGLVIFDISSPAEKTEIAITGGAQSVEVSGSYAYVTTSANELVVYAIDSTDTSLSGDSSQNRERARFDSQRMELTIPEVDVDGSVYTLVMKQRGSSNNFEVTFIEDITDSVASDDDTSAPAADDDATSDDDTAAPAADDDATSGDDNPAPAADDDATSGDDNPAPAADDDATSGDETPAPAAADDEPEA